MESQLLATSLYAPIPAGLGVCAGHHGEILQGVFRQAGRLVRGLVTLPFPDAVTHASATLDEDGSTVDVRPQSKVKAAVAARLTLDFLGIDGGCRVRVHGGGREGIGIGTSTCDVVATIQAVADAAGHSLSGDEIARLAVTAETASDSVMFPEAVTLFAHREGRVLEVLGPALPPLLVVGCSFGPDNGVDTLTFPPARYSDDEIARSGVLLSALRYAIHHGDPAMLGRVATSSAVINQRFLPIAEFGELQRLANRSGAVGLQVAHTGTVAGVLFDGRDPDAVRRGRRCRRELTALGARDTRQFVP
jgi:uncharacterized protein involved in propanediol utilization